MFRHGMSTSLIEHQYDATRRVYHCFMLAPPTAGASLVFGLMAGHIARQQLAPRFLRHLDYLHRTLLLTLGLLAFVFVGWEWAERASGQTGLAAGLSGVLMFFAMRLYIGWRGLQAMHDVDFPEENANAHRA